MSAVSCSVDRRQPPAQRLKGVLQALRRSEAIRRSKARETSDGLASRSPLSLDSCVERLEAAYSRVRLDPRAQSFTEKSRVWAQACLDVGHDAPALWALDDDEARTLGELLERVLEARMDGEILAEELTIPPNEQVSRLRSWLLWAFEIGQITRQEIRASDGWRRFGTEVVASLETCRSRDDWKLRSVRWLAAASNMVRFAEKHMDRLWSGEVNGFVALALVRLSPHRLAPALARALPQLQGPIIKLRRWHYERAVVAVLRTKAMDSIALVSDKLLKQGAIKPGAYARESWAARVQTHLVRFACAAGERVLAAWLALTDQELLRAATSQWTQSLLKSVLQTQCTADFPKLLQKQTKLAHRVYSLLPCNSRLRGEALGQRVDVTRLEAALGKCLRALLVKPAHATAHDSPCHLQVLPPPRSTPGHRPGRCTDVLEFVVANGPRSLSDRDFHALPDDPQEEPEAKSGDAFYAEGIADALIRLCGEAPTALQTRDFSSVLATSNIGSRPLPGQATTQLGDTISSCAPAFCCDASAAWSNYAPSCSPTSWCLLPCNSYSVSWDHWTRGYPVQFATSGVFQVEDYCGQAWLCIVVNAREE